LEGDVTQPPKKITTLPSITVQPFFFNDPPGLLEASAFSTPVRVLASTRDDDWDDDSMWTVG